MVPTVTISQTQAHMIGASKWKVTPRRVKLKFYRDSPGVSFSACAYVVPTCWNVLQSSAFLGKLLLMFQNPNEMEPQESRDPSVLFLPCPRA